MDKFTTLTAIAAPLPMANVDTDMIIPSRFLKTIKRSGLGVHLFDALRYDEQGRERAGFVLNTEPYRHAEILIAHENFGCGSSREHAPWALLDFGIRCVIAPDFADIFHTNCFKNGILPVRLPRAVCDALMDDARLGGNARVTVDLERQVVVRPNGEEIAFTIDELSRHSLLNGLDDIGQTLRHEARITAHEHKLRAEQPWMPALSVG
jgi:3-isopropylmalate/(R)-2-methylmalate dehydratase small subunit